VRTDVVRRMITVALFMLGSGGCVTPGSAPVEPPTASVFEERYAAMKSAVASRDAKAIASLLTPDFTSESTSGKTESAAATVQELMKVPKDPDRISETKVLSVKVSGDTATVEQRFHMTTTKFGPDGTTPHPVDLRTASTDTWVKVGKVWLWRKTVTNQLDYKVDGRVVFHQVHPTKP